MKNDLIIEATHFTPEIRFLYSENRLSISGESYPENTSEFYGPVFESLAHYLENVSEQTVTVDVYLKYFNSSSSKILINLFDLLERSTGKGTRIIVNWLYKKGDDDSREFGEEFAEDLFELEFNIVAQ